MFKALTFIKILLTVILTVFNSNTTLDAQVRLQDPDAETKPFSERLWYGGSVNLGFQGTNTYNVFFFGISPMVGYKITEEFSLGPRFEFLYTHYKAFVRFENKFFTAQPVSISAGAFARYKFLNQFFGHVEYNMERATYPDTAFGDFYVENGKLATRTRSFDNFFIGLGYTSGGRFGSEISILYNVLVDSQTLNNPISIRIGFNYNF